MHFTIKVTVITVNTKYKVPIAMGACLSDISLIVTKVLGYRHITPRHLFEYYEQLHLELEYSRVAVTFNSPYSQEPTFILNAQSFPPSQN